MLRFLPLLQRKVQHLSFTVNTLRPITQLGSKTPENTTNDDAVKTEQATTKEQTSDMPVADMQNPFAKEKPKCILCKYEITPDYKNVRLLSQFVSPYTGRTYGRHITGLCKAKQESVEKEITKSQNCGLMPYYFKSPSYLKDPKIFDVENPLRPHRFE